MPKKDPRTSDIAVFITKANALMVDATKAGLDWKDIRVAVQTLCDPEIDLIYQRAREKEEQAKAEGKSVPKSSAHNAFQAYATALDDAGLRLYFLDMPTDMYLPGDRIFGSGTPHERIAGFLRMPADRLAEQKANNQAAMTVRLHESTGLLEGREEEYPQYIKKLCQSDYTEEVCLALIGATGRRPVEIYWTGSASLTAKPYELTFQGRVKGRSEERKDASEVIPVLIPAVYIVEQLPRVQQWVDNTLQKETGEITEQLVNKRIGNRIREVCEPVFKLFFGDESKVTPDDLRKFYNALIGECLTPQGPPLCDPRIAIHTLQSESLGHLTTDNPTDHYQDHRLPRVPRFMLPE